MTKTLSKKHAYITTMKAQLDTLNDQINTLEGKAKEVKEDVRDTYRDEMKKLRHQSKLAVAKYDEVKEASEESWEGMVAEMDKIRDAFTHSFNYFKSQV